MDGTGRSVSLFVRPGEPVERRRSEGRFVSAVENHGIRTGARGEFVDLTEEVGRVVARSGVRDGMVVVYSPHTTCAVLINELERGFIEDFRDFLEGLVPVDRPYRHDDLSVRTQNLEDDPHDVPNGWAHVRQSLLATASQTIPVVEGRLLLGRWQRIFLVELDRARDRRVLIQVVGEG